MEKQPNEKGLQTSKVDNPEPLSFMVRSKEELEQKLLEAIEQVERGEVEEITPDFWKKLKDDLIKHHSQSRGQDTER